MKTIHETIKKQMVDAMRAQDEVKLNTLRSLIAMFSYELIAKKSKEALLDDVSALVLIKRNVNQHKDSIEQFEKGGRKDLVKKEKEELAILEAFLPQMMSKKNIEKIVKEKIKKEGKPNMKKIGQFIGVLMKELKGKADGADMKAVIDSLVG
ncbi:MAG: GatB/YqeY domain-containing protein [Patescibacteria group bacterium]